MSHRSSQSLEVEPEPDRKEEDEARFVSPTLCFVSSLGQIKDRIDYLALGQTELATQQAELLHRVEYFGNFSTVSRYRETSTVPRLQPL